METDVNQVKEYLEGKVRTIVIHMRLSKKNAEEIAKVKDTLGKLKEKLTLNNHTNSPSTEPGDARNRAVTTAQQASVASCSAVLYTLSIPTVDCESAREITGLHATA